MFWKIFSGNTHVFKKYYINDYSGGSSALFHLKGITYLLQHTDEETHALENNTLIRKTLWNPLKLQVIARWTFFSRASLSQKLITGMLAQEASTTVKRSSKRFATIRSWGLKKSSILWSVNMPGRSIQVMEVASVYLAWFNTAVCTH